MKLVQPNQSQNIRHIPHENKKKTIITNTITMQRTFTYTKAKIKHYHYQNRDKATNHFKDDTNTLFLKTSTSNDVT
jgi:hypothetical protein